MPNESRPLDRHNRLSSSLIIRMRVHEFVEKLAYKLWVQRGRPLGSPEVDWFAAEQAVYESLVASGKITPSPNNPQRIMRRDSPLDAKWLGE